MSLAHALLTSLLEKPSSGYDLARRFDKSLGFFWSATHQQIYRELKRMEEAGWIDSEAAEDAGKTKKRTYSVLPAGRTELQAWVKVPSEPHVLRDEAMVRLRAEAILGPLGMQEEMQRHLAFHQERLNTYLAIAQRDLSHPQHASRERQIQHRILQLGIDTEQTWIKWTQETLDLLKQLDQPYEENKQHAEQHD